MIKQNIESDLSQISETTQELLNKKFDITSLNKSQSNSDHSLDNQEILEKNDKLTPDKNVNLDHNIVQQKEVCFIGPQDISHENTFSEDSDEGIIVTEVNLVTPDKDRRSKADIQEEVKEQKEKVAEEILETLLREIQEFMFPVRLSGNEGHLKSLESKYSEKFVGSQVNKKFLGGAVMDEEQESQEFNMSDISMGEYEGEIMQNFNIIRNFEMKRTRAEKNQYDNLVF
jgi:hypothetical protein